MPIHEFSCRGCGERFEALIRKTTVVACPACQGSDLEQLFSLPVVRSESTRQRVSRDVKQRDSRQAAERNHAQRQYEQSHDD
jgi:putative FmdB family regulatory protein